MGAQSLHRIVTPSDKWSLTTTILGGHMFGNLLESRARRHRRTGGAVLSVAAHIAIIGFTTAATMRGKAASHTPPKPEFLVFQVAPAPKPIERRAATAATQPVASRTMVPAPITLTIAPPLTVPLALPN